MKEKARELQCSAKKETRRALGRGGWLCLVEVGWTLQASRTCAHKLREMGWSTEF